MLSKNVYTSAKRAVRVRHAQPAEESHPLANGYSSHTTEAGDAWNATACIAFTDPPSD